MKLLDYNAGVYESEITEFYENLSVNEDLVLSSFVNGTMITLTVTELAQILGVPSSGFSDLPYQSWPLLSGIDNATISHTLSDQPLPHAQIFSVSHLSAPHDKLLRNLITKSVLPRIENRGECLIMDQVLLWLLIHDIPISLPHLMILHMKNLSQTSLYYPYGLWLTEVFEAFDVLCPHTKVMNFQGLKIARYAPTIFHLLFAYDAIFFFRAFPQNCWTLKKVMSDFYFALGEMVNFLISFE